MYEVLLDDGRKVRKHTDQLRSQESVTLTTDSASESDASYETEEFDARIPRSEGSIVL